LPQVQPRDPSTWRLAGQRVPRVDNLAKATGAPIYGIDTKVPDMVSAWVLHAPAPQSRAVLGNEREILAMPGVRQVVGTSRGLAVVADKYWQAKAAGARLKVDWQAPAAEPFSSAEHLSACVQGTRSFAGSAIAGTGSVELGAGALEAV
ncbi:MAG: hypothetical protein RLZZ341_2774, partial [Pseudomonadota bacterium]